MDSEGEPVVGDSDWWADARQRGAAALPQLTDAQCRDMLRRLFVQPVENYALAELVGGIEGYAQHNADEQVRSTGRRH